MLHYIHTLCVFTDRLIGLEKQIIQPINPKQTLKRIRRSISQVAAAITIIDYSRGLFVVTALY